MGDYDDIIHMQHPTSKRHPRMAAADRAAQFSPFAALTGHDAAIRETARLTDGRIELTEEEITRLNERLRRVSEFAKSDKEFSFTYFVPDGKKSGGSYRTCSGPVKKLDPILGEIVMKSGLRIPMDTVTEIEGELFERAAPPETI